MVRLYIILAIAAVAVSIFTLITAIMTQRDSVRTLPKHIWLPIIVLLPVLGSVLWFIFGHPKPGQQARGNAYDTPPGGSAKTVNAELQAQRVSASDDKISELERRLQELDAEATAQQNLTAQQDLAAQQNLAAQQDLAAQQNLAAQQDLTAPQDPQRAAAASEIQQATTATPEEPTDAEENPR